MARINFITSFRNKMMKTPICIHLASKIGAPIIDADFDGDHWTRISKLFGTILEEPNRERVSPANEGFIGLWFREMRFSPMWVDFEDAGSDTESEKLSDLLESIYDPDQDRFKIIYKGISPKFQGGKFHIIGDLGEIKKLSDKVFIDCPGGGIRFHHDMFVEQLGLLKEKLRNIEIFLYHVVDYNSILSETKPILGDRGIAQSRLISLSNAFKEMVDNELNDILRAIDGIALIVNFHELEIKLSEVLFSRLKKRSAKDNLRSLTFRQEPFSLYDRFSNLEEIYSLDECPGFSKWRKNKYENVYDFLIRSRWLGSCFRKMEVGIDEES